MVRICKHCKKEKDETLFCVYRKKFGKTIYMNVCIDCDSDKKRLMNKARQCVMGDRKRILVELKGNKCKICAKSYPLPCYDFHHRDPSTKEHNLGKLFIRDLKDDSWLTWVLPEVDKCDLLCSNCHRILHYGDGRNG
jgi:hypothetical protein